MPRIAPDIFDQIVWPLTETSGAYRNVGQLLPNDVSTDLNISNSVIRTGSGLFTGNSLWIPGNSNLPAGSNATRNYAAGAQTINIAPPITVSCWVYLRNYNTTNVTTIISKEYRDSGITSSWTTPFHAINISTLTTNGGGDWQVTVATSSSTRAILTVTDFPIPIGTWSHIGITHDGTNIRAYLNGCPCMYYSGSTQLFTTAASTISYTDGVNGFGYWRVGATTSTGATREETDCNIQDVRIANVARSLDYFKRVYESGVLPLRAGGFIQAQYYKLRAYDTSCTTPTPVVWIDTEISLANAPPFPCIGPYSTPEVIDTWFA